MANPAPVVFDSLHSGAAAMDVLATDRSTPAALATQQRKRLTRLLQAALQNSPLYRERLRGVSPASVRLDTLPVVTKEVLMQRFDEWVCDPQLKLAELRAFTADPRRIAEPYLGKYVAWESSGTSGQPGVFVQDAQAMATYDALEALRRSAPQPLQRWIDPLYMTERIAFVGATTGHFASYVSILRLCQLNPWAARAMRSFSILQSTASLTDALNDYAPTIISTYPTVAALLADEAARGALVHHPREVWTGGETLTPGVRKWVEKSLNCAVRNSYGASEFLTIGWECGQGHLHANTDWLILEPVDQKGHPVAPGEPSHTTLLTNLVNTVQPLIRYDLGDQITFGRQRCACGSPLPVIEVAGRHDDPLNMLDRDGRPVTLLPLALTTALEDQAAVFEFQLLQVDGHTLELRLPQSGPAAAAALARCRHVLRGLAQQHGLAPIKLIGKCGVTLARGRSGKVQRVVARLKP
ncbi:MAG: phenylacetate--CoA ligase family protein [Rhodoferax sp.]|nr:phenylacetate--CoA ligase family protein [Rhodoferax sp.]